MFFVVLFSRIFITAVLREIPHSFLKITLYIICTQMSNKWPIKVDMMCAR